MPYRKRQRSTPQRRIILEELQKVRSHPTASELYELVRIRIPKISLGTVYRNLELLAEQGTIKKLSACGKETRFDGVVNPHYHVFCCQCGRVDDVFDLPKGFPLETPEYVCGYRILGQRLEFFGICPKCNSCPRDIQHEPPKEKE
ncbi:MAG: transcriptional repressor [Pirellulales bacterium]|nr:transcriptional repressor [Pirellulales bacterium]